MNPMSRCVRCDQRIWRHEHEDGPSWCGETSWTNVCPARTDELHDHTPESQGSES